MTLDTSILFVQEAFPTVDMYSDEIGCDLSTA